MEYIEQEQDGKKVNVYTNGAIQDAKTGYWIKPPRDGTIRTSERGRELANIRHQKTRDSIIAGIREGLGIPVTAMAGEEVKILARITTERFIDSKNIRGMDSLLKTLLALGGYIETLEDTQQNINQDGPLREFVRDMAIIARKIPDKQTDVV